MADVSIRFGVEGGASFKTSLAAINSEIKNLDAQMKSASAGFGDSSKQMEVLGKSTDALKNKMALLQGQYDKENSKLKELAKALEEAKNAEGDNSQAIAKAENAYLRQVKVVNDLGTQLNNTNAKLKDSEKAIAEVGDASEDSEKKVSKLSQVGTMLKTAFAAAAITAGVKAITDLGKSALTAYADFEQLSGGVETLFKDANGTVMQNAQNAFKTVGISANEYMENVTAFSASLISSLAGDTEKAAKVADMAMVDMADNANKMGTDMASIQNAYQGFAKQNYTMLDNLKLGYGGTKSEMERLLADAEKFSGIKYDISSYSDIIEAIHVIQTEMGVTGTTAKEAETTITGSINMTKAAFDNFLTSLGTGEGVQTAVQSVMDAVDSVVQNIAPVAERIVQGLVEALPSFVDAAYQMVMSLVDGIMNNVQPLVEAAVSIIQSLMEGLTQTLPELIPACIEIVLSIVDYLLQNLPMLVQGAIQLANGIFTGLVQAIPMILQAVPNIISQLVVALITAGKELTKVALQWGKDLIDNFVSGIKSKINAVKDAVKSVAKTVKDFLGFSEPDKGPLSDFHTYAPDMIDLFTKGIYNNLYKVQSASASLAGAASPGLDFATAKALMGGNSAGSGSTHLVIQIGNKTIYEAYNEELIRNGRNMVTV